MKKSTTIIEAIQSLHDINQEQSIKREVFRREMVDLIKEAKEQLAYYGETNKSAMTIKLMEGLKKLTECKKFF